METTSFHVPSISCSTCAGKIQDSLKPIRGVDTVSVDMQSKTVTVDYNPQDVNPQDIRKKIASIGYEVIQ